MKITFILSVFLSFALSSAKAERIYCDHDLKPRVTSQPSLASPGGRLVQSPFLVPALKKYKNNHHHVDDRKTDYDVDFKILILSALEDDAGLEVATQALDSLWIPYDVLILTEDGSRKPEVVLELIKPDGSGRYSGVVTTEFNLSYFDQREQKYLSALNPYEWDELNQYLRNYHIRQVSLFTYPQEYIGVREFPDAQNDVQNAVEIDPKYISSYISGLKIQNTIGLKDVWHYPVSILQSHQQQTKAFLKFTNQKDSIAGVLHRSSDDREQMHFFFSQGKDLFLSQLLSSVWARWLVKNVYTGQRRVYLTAQVDDVFIPTPLWNPMQLLRPNSEIQYYRNSTEDIKEYLKFQNSFLKQWTHDPHFKIEMAFNGKGIAEYGGLSVDPLTQYLKRRANQFYWVSHTYNHLELDTLNYEQVRSEVEENNKIALSFLEDDIHLYSTRGLVTPRISGLFNPQALNAFSDLNYYYVVGDNTVDLLAPIGNKHIPRKTTLEINGFEGLSIMPRFPNDVFYNVSTPWELESLFNHLYQYEGEDRLGLEEILDKNAKELTSALINFDHSMHMFHQANMRLFDYEGNRESLLSLWFKRGLSEYRKFSTLPILSLNMDDLIDAYNVRVQYERCELVTTLSYTQNKLKAMRFNSNRECTIPITGLDYFSLVTPDIINFKRYGPDKTVYVKSRADQEVVIFVDNE